MRSIPETENLYDHLTEPAACSGSAGGNISPNMMLIAVMERNRIISIHFPSQKSLSIGRSGQNDIRLSDPHFPRKAAEIILGPLPLLRKMARVEQKSHEIISISPGKPFKIYPYTFCLLKTGNILVNRYKKSDRSKTPGRWLFVSVAIAMLAGIPAYQFFSGSNSENLNSEISFETTANKHADSLKADNTRHQQSMEPQLSNMFLPGENQKGGFEKIKNAEQISKQRFVQNRSSKGKGKYPDHTENLSIPKNQGIPAADLEILIKLAVRFFDTGNPELAGRTIYPVLLHLNEEQKSHLVQRLEPGMYSLYRKAYMLMEYDKPSAMTALGRIVASRLDILPCYGKARSLLESEKSVEDAIRATSGRRDSP